MAKVDVETVGRIAECCRRVGAAHKRLTMEEAVLAKAHEHAWRGDREVLAAIEARVRGPRSELAAVLGVLQARLNGFEPYEALGLREPSQATEDRQVPVIYRLDEQGEAEDVQWYCSTGCRDVELAVDAVGRREVGGTSSDWIEGTVCERCGKGVGGEL
jgi:hypothetical protein